MMDVAELGLYVDATGVVRADASLKKLGTTAKRTEKDTAGLNRQFSDMRNIVRQLGPLLAGLSVVATFSRVISETAKFETALIGVSKTTGLAGRDLDMLAGRIDKLSREIPVTTDELLGMAQAAGQMGVTGADNLEKFSRTVAMLGRASDLAGDQAATALARILNVTGENISQVDILASVIVSLGNNVAATESEIAHMTTRIARATAAFGVSSDQAAALGAALASVGVEAEAGGTAVGQAFSGITNAVNAGGKELEKFAGALGLNAKLLAETFQTDKIAGFEMFLGRLAELGDGAGLALEAAGLGGIRLAQSLIPLGRNIEIYQRTQKLANDEVKDATALNREFEATLNTLDSQWIVTQNITSSFARELGGNLSPAVKSALSGFNEWASEGDNVAKVADVISTAIAGLAFVVGTRLTVALGSATIATGKKAAAAIAEAKATATASAAEVQYLRTVQGSLVAQLKNNQSTAAAAGLRAQLSANTAALTAAQNTHTAALARSTVAARATTAATTALRGSMALLGGPAGAAMVAAGAIYYFATRTSEADKILSGLEGPLGSVADKFREISAAERELAANALASQISDRSDKIDTLNRKLENQAAVIARIRELTGGEVDDSQLSLRLKYQAQIAELTRENASEQEKLNTLLGVTASVASEAAAEVDRLIGGSGLTDGAMGFETMAAGAGVLKKEIQDIPVMLRGVAISASEAAAATKTLTGEQIKSLEELAAKYELNTQLIGVTASREQELIKMRAAGIDVTSDYAQAVLEAAGAYDTLVAKQEASDEAERQATDSQKSIEGIISALDDQYNHLVLTEKQYLALQLTASGATSAQIAQAMKLHDAIKALPKSLSNVESELSRIQRAADPAFAAMEDYQSAMDTLADSLLNNLIDDQKFVALADHLLQVRDAALEAAEGMSWLDKMEGGMDALQSGFQQIHSTMDSGSKEAEKLGQAMQALSVVQGIAAILNQGMGDPYTAIGRMAAMAAAVASLIGSVGFAGSGNTAAADVQASQGTGSVLGDSTAKSESILKASEITADATSSLVSINRGMLTALQALQRGIGSAAGMIVRNDAGFSGAIEGYGAIPEHDPIGALTGVRLDFVGDFVKDLLGGSSKVVNEGIAIASGRISELIDGTLVSAFQDVESKKSFLHSKKTTRQAEALGDAASAQFSLIFSSMADVVTEAGIALGVSGSELEKKIAAFQVNAFEISLKDLSGEEQQAEIEAVFSSIFDGLAGAVAPYAAEFQKVGEGMAETLVRVATQVQVTQEAVKMLGINIGEGLSPAELARASDELVTLGGGLENFIDSMKSFVSAFASEQQKITTATDGVASVFDNVGISAGVPQTAQELTALMATLTDPKQINGLLSLTDSFKELFAAQDKTFALNQQLLRAQGESDAALVRERERELLALTDSQRALQLRIWALNDEASAAEEAAQAHQALADLQRGIGDQLLDIISPAHAQLERLNRAMGDQIAQAQELGVAEGDLINMRNLHQLQLMRFAAGLEESIASLNTELFGSAENAMDRTVSAVDSGMNRIRESMISAIDGVNKWLDSSMLSSVSPLTPEDRLGEAERQFNLQFAGAMGGDTDAMAALPKLADQLLSEASGFFGGSTQEFDQIWMQVRDAMEQVSGLSIPDAQDPQRAIQQATESTAMSALQQITLASDMVGQIAALSRVTGETPADIADRLDVPIRGLLDIMESTPGEFAGAMDQNFNDLVNGFDMTIDPLLSVQNAQLEETRQMRTEQNERLDRIEQALLDGVNYQRATAVNTGETATQQGQAVAIQRRNENKPTGAGRINV